MIGSVNKYKFIVIVLGLLLCSLFAIEVKAAEIPSSEFEDQNLYSICLERYDTDDDGILETEEVEAVNVININAPGDVDKVTSLKGLEYFTNLMQFITYGEGFRAIKDISPIADLKYLDMVYFDNFVRVENWYELEKATSIKSISLYYCYIDDVSFIENMTSMEYFYMVDAAPVENISVLSGMTNLTSVHIPENSVTDISFLSKATHLTQVILDGNDISDFTPLLSSAETITTLYISDTISKTGADLSFLSKLSKLESLCMSYNELNKMPDLTSHTNMTLFRADKNYFTVEDMMNNLPDSVKQSEGWEEYAGIYDQKSEDDRYKRVHSEWHSKAMMLSLDSVSEKGLYEAILEKADEDGNGTLDEYELKTVVSVSINYVTSGLEVYEGGVSTLEGLQHFKYLKLFSIHGDSTIQLEDISAVGALAGLEVLVINQQYVIPDYASLENLSNLKELDLTNTNVEDIGFLKNKPNLTYLSLEMCNYLKEANEIGGLSKLEYLMMTGTRVTDISCLSNCTKLCEVDLYGNAIYNFESLLASKDTLISLQIGNYHQDYSLQLTKENISFLRQLYNLREVSIIDSHLLELPDLTKLSNIKHVMLHRNHLTIEELEKKLPKSFFSNVPEWMDTTGIKEQIEYDPTTIGMLNKDLIHPESGIEAGGKFVNDAYIVAQEKEQSEHMDVLEYIQKNVSNNEWINIYDISVYKYYKLSVVQDYGRVEKTQPVDGAVVTMPIEYDSKYVYYAYRQELDGTISKLECIIDNGMVTFITDHFSIFSIVAVKVANSILGGNTQNDISVSVPGIQGGTEDLDKSLLGNTNIMIDILAISIVVITISICEIMRRITANRAAGE